MQLAGEVELWLHRGGKAYVQRLELRADELAELDLRTFEAVPANEGHLSSGGR